MAPPGHDLPPGGIIRFYIDGELVGMENAPLCQEHDSDLWFGAYTGVSEEFIGDIDEVRLWSVERTQAEIQASMNLVLEEAPGLISAWHLDGNGLDSVAGNHGTLFGDAEFVASDAPVAFVTVPPRADWRGGETVLLSNVYGVQDPMPTVLFDGIPSPAVSRVLDQSLRAIVPPGKQPGARVAVEIVSPQVNVLSTQPFLYTPHLEGPTEGALGDEVELVLRFDPPAQIALARGGLLAGASPMQRYGWFLEIDRPVIAFSASAPTQRTLTIPVKIPHVPELIGTPLAFQALVGPSFDGTNASFTNTHVLMVQPGPD